MRLHDKQISIRRAMRAGELCVVTAGLPRALRVDPAKGAFMARSGQD
jgi:hypothetical protein